jgi:hypothetical protein
MYKLEVTFEFNKIMLRSITPEGKFMQQRKKFLLMEKNIEYSPPDPPVDPPVDCARDNKDCFTW